MPLRSLFAALLCVGVLSGCSALAEDPVSWHLDDGTPLRSLAAADEPVVVFVIDPTDVPPCQNILAGWLDWRSRTSERLCVVLSRRPAAGSVGSNSRRNPSSVRLNFQRFVR